MAQCGENFLVLEIRPEPDKFFSELPPEAHFPSVRLSIDKASPDKLQAVMLAPTFPTQNFASFPLCCYLPVSRSNGTLSSLVQNAKLGKPSSTIRRMAKREFAKHISIGAINVGLKSSMNQRI